MTLALGEREILGERYHRISVRIAEGYSPFRGDLSIFRKRKTARNAASKSE